MKKYREEDLGKEAVFLIPLAKIDPVRQEIHDFLSRNYGSFTLLEGNISGVWRGQLDGPMVLYIVAFVGKERIPALKEFLVEIAKKIGEEWIYIRTGESARRIGPLVLS